jgi:transposase InsO family protein
VASFRWRPRISSIEITSNIQTDNGSEFHRHFEAAFQQLNLKHYWSRIKTPKDNAVNERFNQP